MNSSKKLRAAQRPGWQARIWMPHAILIGAAAGTLAGGPAAPLANTANAGAVDSTPAPTAFAPTYEEVQNAYRDRGLFVSSPTPPPLPATVLPPSQDVAGNADGAALPVSDTSGFPTLHVVIGGLIGAGIGLILGALVFFGAHRRGHPVRT